MQAGNIERGDLIESGTFEHSVGVSGMNVEGVKASGFRISVQRNFIRLARALLVDHER